MQFYMYEEDVCEYQIWSLAKIEFLVPPTFQKKAEIIKFENFTLSKEHHESTTAFFDFFLKFEMWSEPHFLRALNLKSSHISFIHMNLSSE